MSLLPEATPSPLQSGRLEASIVAIEQRLGALGSALRDQDLPAIELQAHDLHRVLAGAMTQFTQAARTAGGVPVALRRRLASASGQVGAQRESLARATAALDRAIDVLMPAPVAAPAYAASGTAARAPRADCLRA